MDTVRHNVVTGCWYPEINGLRAVAILMVMWMHSSFYFLDLQSPGQQIYHSFISLGTHGVDLFFVISGFLITGILIDTSGQKNSLKKFYIRRTLRIFPVYYLTLVLGISLLFFIVPDFSLGIREAMYFVYLQNLFSVVDIEEIAYFRVFWSLAVEEQYYLFWPVIFLWARKQSWELFLCITLIFASVLGRSILVDGGAFVTARDITFLHMDGLCLGGLLAVLIHKFGKSERMRKISFMSLIMIGTVYALYAIFSKGSFADIEIVLKYGIIIFSLFYFFLLMWILTNPENNLFKTILRSPPLQSIGSVSYGMYIFHGPIMFFAIEHSYFKSHGYWGAHLGLLATGVVLSYILAFMSYKFFEKPILKLKYRYANYE